MSNLTIPTNKKHDWYKIENKATSTDVYIYGDIGWETTAKDFTQEIRTIYNDINLHLNTPGGNVFDGNAIFNELKAHPSTVNVYIDGMAASIGSIIAMAGDTINIAKNGFVMIHNPFTMAVGNSEEIRKTADMLDKVKDSLVQTYTEKTGVSASKIVEWMDDATWFNAEESLEHGFATNIVGKVDIEDKFDLTVYNHVPADVAEMYQKQVYKNESLSIRSVEKALRDVGCTISQAKVQAKAVIDGISGDRQRDVDKSLREIDNQLTKLLK